MILIIDGVAYMRFSAETSSYKREIEAQIPLGSSFDEVMNHLKSKNGRYGEVDGSILKEYNALKMISFISNKEYKGFLYVVSVRVLFVFDSSDKLIRVVYTSAYTGW